MLQHVVKTLDDVDEKYRDLYTETKDGFEVQVKGVAEMKRAKDREKEARFEAEEKLKQAIDEHDALKARLTELEEKAHDGHRDSGDLEALEKSYQAKLDKATQTIEGLESNIRAELVDRAALEMAVGLAVQGSEKLLEPHIRKRLDVEIKDGRHRTVVLDEDGRPSALTLDELKTEISDNAAFAPVIVGSKGSGSGATQSTGGSAAPTMKRSDFDAMSAQGRMDHMKSGGTLIDD